MSTTSFLDDLFSSFLADRRSNGLFFRLSTGIGNCGSRFSRRCIVIARPPSSHRAIETSRGARESRRSLAARKASEVGWSGIDRSEPRSAQCAPLGLIAPEHRIRKLPGDRALAEVAAAQHPAFSIRLRPCDAPASRTSEGKRLTRCLHHSNSLPSTGSPRDAQGQEHRWSETRARRVRRPAQIDSAPHSV